MEERAGWNASRNNEFDMPHIYPERDARATSASPDVAFKDEGLAGDMQISIKVWV